MQFYAFTIGTEQEHDSAAALEDDARCFIHKFVSLRAKLSGGAFHVVDAVGDVVDGDVVIKVFGVLDKFDHEAAVVDHGCSGLLDGIGVPCDHAEAEIAAIEADAFLQIGDHDAYMMDFEHDEPQRISERWTMRPSLAERRQARATRRFSSALSTVEMGAVPGFSTQRMKCRHSSLSA